MAAVTGDALVIQQDMPAGQWGPLRQLNFAPPERISYGRGKLSSLVAYVTRNDNRSTLEASSMMHLIFAFLLTG
jgi:hypothetical protein